MSCIHSSGMTTALAYFLALLCYLSRYIWMSTARSFMGQLLWALTQGKSFCTSSGLHFIECVVIFRNHIWWLKNQMGETHTQKKGITSGLSQLFLMQPFTRPRNFAGRICSPFFFFFQTTAFGNKCAPSSKHTQLLNIQWCENNKIILFNLRHTARCGSGSVAIKSSNCPTNILTYVWK